ncbi:hypothetical protein HOP50_02g13880 [Chloropicon primus]|nr:hypothetical protein HOP50_02g13880 [Chloropicon primus]
MMTSSSASKVLTRVQSEGGLSDAALFDIDLDDLTWSPTSLVSEVDDALQLEQDLATLGTICSAASVKEEKRVRRIRKVLRSGDDTSESTESTESSSSSSSSSSSDSASSSGAVAKALGQLGPLGYPVSVASSRRKIKGDIFRCPHHEFLRMDVDDGLIIDPNFRSRWEVARSSYYYSKVVQALPCVFVGTEARLRLLVTFMSEQLNRNYKVMSMDCPPWRGTKSLLNTWAL